MKRFYLFNKDKDMTDVRFLELFQTLVSVITECGGEIGHNPVGILAALKDKGGGLESATPTELDEAKSTAKERYLAVAILSAADKSRYRKLTEKLGNDYTKGSNHYPKTVTEAYNLILNYQWSRPGGRVYNDTDGVAFTNVESKRPPRPRVTPPDIVTVKCYNCNEKGHYSNECLDNFPDEEPTKETEKGKGTTDGLTTTMTVDEDKPTTYDNWEEFNFHQSNRKVKLKWILLDNCSTTDIFCNTKTANGHPALPSNSQNPLQRRD
jgi:hypothetical protein